MSGSRRVGRRSAPLVLATLLMGLGWAAAGESEYRRPEPIPAPAHNPLTPACIDLGKHLFFDPRLSGSNRLSCSGCHQPEKGWSDGRPRALSAAGEAHLRNTPSLFNVAYQRFLAWDGEYESLEEQALTPLKSVREMGQDLDELPLELGERPEYRSLFERAYPGAGINLSTITQALACFERSIVSESSPFDRWIQGEAQAVDASAERGFALFQGKANCAACHHGFNFSDGDFHNTGLSGGADLGRFEQVPVEALRRAFRTPTLRGLGHTAPYMHDGRFASLEAVIDHYNRGGDDMEGVDPMIRPLYLTEAEKRDLIHFLKALSGPPASFSRPAIP